MIHKSLVIKNNIISNHFQSTLPTHRLWKVQWRSGRCCRGSSRGVSKFVGFRWILQPNLCLGQVEHGEKTPGPCSHHDLHQTWPLGICSAAVAKSLAVARSWCRRWWSVSCFFFICVFFGGGWVFFGVCVSCCQCLCLSCLQVSVGFAQPFFPPPRHSSSQSRAGPPHCMG